MKLKLIGCVIAALLLAGCATNNNLYQWGNYEDTLFAHFHEPEVKEEMLASYIAFLEKSQNKSKKKVAPGLFAEAGTFMLEKGDATAAVRFYELERSLWPESEPLMTMLIQNLKAREQTVQEQTP
ncbi:DUF4810 domain-containing protein [Pseudidiomarina woesei]|uniref:DUF4810 domain-containing protein n=1 Tax=Pseudidiomarina woesei TaxID=1381080 RepID=A0A0K6H8N4_9GAMM|nr:DUF4810 domain-containing protein [Pseudidiomarina woesei]CUA87366.1 Uncharacterized protein Ga0061064_1778 [Pseudidiomarina woesei]